MKKWNSLVPVLLRRFLIVTYQSSVEVQIEMFNRLIRTSYRAKKGLKLKSTIITWILVVIF